MSTSHKLVLRSAVIAVFWHFWGGSAAHADPIRATPRYTITELGVRTPNTSQGNGVFVPLDLNNRGEVLGYFRGGEDGIYSNGSFEYGRGGSKFNDHRQYAGPYDSDINNGGQTVRTRTITNPDGSRSEHAVLATPNELSPSGREQDLGTAGARDSVPLALNDRGQVVGFLKHSDGRETPFFYDGSVMLDLGDLGVGSRTIATGINAAGQVVGGNGVGGNQAFLLDGGELTLLGVLGESGGHTYSVAKSINDHGQIVGVSTGGPFGEAAFLYENGLMQSLTSLIPTDLDWELIDATHVNNRGEIIGYGIHGGRGSYYLLTPTPVPEPSTLCVFAAIASTIAMRRFIRSRTEKRGHS